MAPNQVRADLNAAEASFRHDAFAPMVDLLRNETPMYFTWFDYSARVPGRIFGVVGTSREPVGEAEWRRGACWRIVALGPPERIGLRRVQPAAGL